MKATSAITMTGVKCAVTLRGDSVKCGHLKRTEMEAPCLRSKFIPRLTLLDITGKQISCCRRKQHSSGDYIQHKVYTDSRISGSLKSLAIRVPVSYKTSRLLTQSRTK